MLDLQCSGFRNCRRMLLRESFGEKGNFCEEGRELGSCAEAEYTIVMCCWPLVSLPSFGFSGLFSRMFGFLWIGKE